MAAAHPGKRLPLNQDQQEDWEGKEVKREVAHSGFRSRFDGLKPLNLLSKRSMTRELTTKCQGAEHFAIFCF